MAGLGIATEKEYLELWNEFKESFRNATPIDTSESRPDKLKRIEKLEADPEAWFKYYFPNYCTAEPAKFHKAATRRIIKNAEWFEVRAWSRELAKTARAMMEVSYLSMTGKIRNVLIVSNSGKNAERILLPFKAFFEANQRLINDYGKQEKFGDWTSTEFTIQKGCSFRSLGWGESPRGTRNENVRPDFILIDDIDTDEECRNEDVMKNKKNWIEQALFGTRSISVKTRILINGNIIHNNCIINHFKDSSDKFDLVNIRDENGKSSWPQKNSEEQIDRVLRPISYESVQKEYFNNPMDGSDIFKTLKHGKVPSLKGCNICIYADPATSNKDTTSGSMKAIGIVAQKGFDYYVVKVFLDTMSNAKFIDYLFECYIFLKEKGIETRIWIENNTLQNPFYEQVLLPLIYKQAVALDVFLPITPDDRPKDDKYSRIEGTLEPINRLGHLILNEKEAKDPHMLRLEAQFKNFSRKQKRMDGPDMIQGAVQKLKDSEAREATGGVECVKRNNPKRF